MKKSWIVAAAALLVLSGCAAEPVVEEDSTEIDGSPAPENQPLQAAEPDTFPSKEAEYLNALRKRTDIATVDAASDDQLLAAGGTACETLADSPVLTDLRLVEGEEPNSQGIYVDSGVIATHANMYLCPELEVTHEIPAP